MRQRRLKNLDEKLNACSSYIVYEDEARDLRGNWRSIFDCGDEDAAKTKLFAEIGCGKGAFLSGLAERDEESLFLGIEIQQSAVAIAGRKLLEAEQKNAKLVNAYVNDLGEIFGEGELDGIYLNFSDPWPKHKHAKRRLTHRNRLESYRRSLKQGGFIEFKSDNDGLYSFTLSEMRKLNYNITAISEDLHKSAYAKGNIMTEYEEKFSNLGKNIYYIRVEF